VAITVLLEKIPQKHEKAIVYDQAYVAEQEQYGAADLEVNV
jgi:hypothetical protein